MSETDHIIPLERRPACDNCKTRKTKCDRRTPCASCTTLKVSCRTTNRAGEKRQRVLISSKYEDAVQDVSRQLTDVKEMLQSLMLSKGTPAALTVNGEKSREAGALTPQSVQSMIDEQVPSLSHVQEGYNGDSSFQSQAQQVKTALESTLTSFGLVANIEQPSIRDTHSEEIHGARKSAKSGMSPSPATPSAIETDNIPLPPLDLVLKLLRLTKVENQIFFFEVPLFDTDEFTELCRDVYFATEPVSLYTWICVNIGLYYLFLELNEADCVRLHTSQDALRKEAGVLRSNAEAAMQSLRLCSEPSMQSCRALALLATFYTREGHSAVAWRLLSGAARACLDLGLHRLPSDANVDKVSRETSLFWHIYAWDKLLAMTCGRTPTIHHYDVSNGLHLLDLPRFGARNVLFGAFLDFAVVTGEIHKSLFSASAYRASKQDRIRNVSSLAARLRIIQSAVQSANRDDPTWDERFRSVAIVLQICLHSQLSTVHRILPPNVPNPHPLQCSNECVDEARRALSVLVATGKAVEQFPTKLAPFLNSVLSFVPFVPFIVLAGNAIATCSSQDLSILSTVVSLLASVASISPTISKIHDACERFSRIAEMIVSSSSPSHHIRDNPAPSATQGPNIGITFEQTLDFGLPMAHQDWDSAMIGFEDELGDYDPRTLTNIMEPYFENAGWGTG
ncbi:hypothetical protein F5Y18DRAFT_415445 [Xylariaceae sp. FL1019]|nr:hypothetical protein F5Y18DRAFT_415445 [Xylariaceae sp. FL1019]